MDTQPKEIDQFLFFFVKGANEFDRPVTEITLSVHGLLVTGQIIGAAFYAEQFSQGKGKESEQAYEQIRQDILAQQDLYIHLQNARVLLSRDFIPTESTVLWRGRLDAIDGFFWGRLV
ncbi:MAG: hypothetical protein KME27_10800 [Lyngbya sp. HA4199-MV5]|jgi:hypothetical protein|nr:hypothetical protein [Lyngbya sp. HA4199-MV5]